MKSQPTPTIDDAHIHSGNSNNNYGSATTLQVDDSPLKHFLLKFDVAGINGQSIISAQLRLSAAVGYNASRNTWKYKVNPINGQTRSNIKPGMTVLIVLKQDQRTGKLTRGIVKDILTKSSNHPHGIKVRLESGEVGRVKEIVSSELEDYRLSH